MKGITIERAENTDINKIVKILNEVTSDLISKNINQWEYPVEEKWIRKDIDEKKIYLILVEDHPVGTFSLGKLEDEKNEFYRNVDGGKYLYRIAILPRLQGLGYGYQVLEFIKINTELKKGDIYLDCWEGNEKLKRFYMNAGLKYIGDYPENDYSISIFKIS